MAKSCESSVQDKITEVTECSICVQIFTNPKILPCVHTFCLHCLEKYGMDKKPGDQMVCPICRNEFFIPEGGLCKLPNNFFIGKMVEIGKLAMASANDLLCGLCPEGEELVAKMYCIDCERRLCERCNTSHSKIKFCQNHQVVQLGGKLNAQNVNLCSSYCDKHPKELTKVYCYDDKDGICLICCVESHQSHRCVNIEKAAGDFMKQLKEDQRKVTMRLPESENIREKLDKCKKEFTEEISKTEEKIIRDAGELKMLIDEHTEILVKDLMLLRERNLEAIEITMQDVETFTVMIDSFSKYSEELLSRGSPVDICRAADQMHTRANELEKLPVNFSGDRFCCDTVVFHPSSFVKLLNQSRSSNAVGELTVIESPDRIIKFGIESTVSVPCEGAGVVVRFIPVDLGMVDIITKYMTDELQEIDAGLKECSGSIDTSNYDLPDTSSYDHGFILRGNESGVGKALKDLQTLTDGILMRDHVIERPGAPAYFYGKHGKKVLCGIQFKHKVSIQVDSRQSRVYPQAEMSTAKSMIPVRGDTVKCKVDGNFNAASVDLSCYVGVADAIPVPEKYATAMQRTRTITGALQEQHEEGRPQRSISMIIFSIYALSKKAIDDALKDIEGVIKGYIDKILDSPQDQQSIAELNPEQVNRIKDMASVFPVQIELVTGCLKRIRIRGSQMEVTSVIDQVHNIFREAQAKETKKMEEERFAKVRFSQEAQNKESKKMKDEQIAILADWEYEYGNVFTKYPEDINAIIEKSYRDGKPYVEWKEDREEHRLTFQTMEEKCITNWATPSFRVRRVAKDMVIDVDVPANWETMRNDEYFKRVQLQASDQEYKDVEKAVLSTAETTVNQIIKIDRIQNKMLYKQYLVRKAAMDAANPGVQNEMTLWYCTSSETLDSISRSGFNPRNCGKRAFVCGRGVCFAKKFSHSVPSTYSSPDPNGYKHVYQCKVLTGEYAVGNENMIVPPSKVGSKTMQYDCTVDNVIYPAIFVIYCDTQVYPEYLIYFK